jgi:hypothetical protein
MISWIVVLFLALLVLRDELGGEGYWVGITDIQRMPEPTTTSNQIRYSTLHPNSTRIFLYNLSDFKRVLRCRVFP